MTPIEKQMITVVVVCIALLGVSLYYVKQQLRTIDESGGLKALVERVWEGKPNE